MYFREFYSQKLDQDFIWRLLFAFCIVALIIGISDAFAAGDQVPPAVDPQNASNTDPIGKVLCNLIKVFRTGTAKGIAIVGVLVVGIQTLRGQLKWEVAFIVIAGVVILFKAPDIVNLIDPTTGGVSNQCVVS